MMNQGKCATSSGAIPDQPSAAYRFEHFTAGLALQDMRFSRSALRAGDQLPAVSLMKLNGARVSLAELADGRPLALVTGSASCPLTVAAQDALQHLSHKYGDRIHFVMVQVREAHPGASLPQPESLREKIAHARILRERLNITSPVLIDDLDGTLHRLLDTLPNSLHIIAPDGEILYRALMAGDEGIESAVKDIAEGRRPVADESQSMAPVLASVGYMHDTLAAAGKGAYADVFKSAPPMALMALGAKIWSRAPRPLRGFSLLGLLGVLAIGGFWGLRTLGVI
jgi:hypothetical protein